MTMYANNIVMRSRCIVAFFFLHSAVQYSGRPSNAPRSPTWRSANSFCLTHISLIRATRRSICDHNQHVNIGFYHPTDSQSARCSVRRDGEQ